MVDISNFNPFATARNALENNNILGRDPTENALTSSQVRRDTNGLNQARYDFNYRVFPSDLGADYNAHYMVININVPTNASGQPRGSDAIRSAFGRTTVLSNEFSKVDNLRFGNSPLNVGGFGAGVNQTFTLTRGTRRIAESIALHMPSGLIFNSQNQYEEVSLTAFAGKAISTVAGALGGGIRARNRSIAQTGQRASAIAGFVDSFGRSIGTVSSLTGNPINPRVEVLYSHTDLRSFRFEVLLAPKSLKESQTIDEIVKLLRFHSAPEVNLNTGGFTFIPPAEFDITFFHRGIENTKMPRINTCVLNVIEVDYSPTGVYSTFKNGYPVAVRLSLGFTEVEPLHKQRVAEGF